MGLVGMVQDAMDSAMRIDLLDEERFGSLSGPVKADDHGAVSRLLTLAENGDEGAFSAAMEAVRSRAKEDACPVVGLTGTGGAGKSSLTDEIMLRIQRDNPGKKIALLATDPTRKRTGGALLGDRIRMNSLSDENLFMRSFASRESGREIADCVGRAIEACQAVGFDMVFVETSGIGQGDDAITEVADVSMYVTTREYGAPSQLEKLEMLDAADIIVLNKFDRRGSEEALSEIRKQFKRNREMWDADDSTLPVIPTIASQFADAGVDMLWERLAGILHERHGADFSATPARVGKDGLPHKSNPIPSERQGYLAEVSAAVRSYHERTAEAVGRVRLVQQLEASAEQMRSTGKDAAADDLDEESASVRAMVPEEVWNALDEFDARAAAYQSGEASYTVRGKEIPVDTTKTTLSGLELPRVALPDTEDWGERLDWVRKENAPGSFPYTGGVLSLIHI